MTLTSKQTGREESTRRATQSWEWPLGAPTARGPSTLTRMHVEHGVSSWLDHVSREDLTNGSLSRMMAAGVRGVGAGRAHALGASADYDEQRSWLLGTGCTAQEAYWEMAATDAQAACAILRPVYEISQGTDGFVSVQAAPSDPRATSAAICRLHRRVDRPNLLVAVSATAPGVQSVQAAVSAGCNINATSIFSLARYSSAIEAYHTGLEALVARGGDPATVYGFASFSLSPLDAEVDRRLEQLGGSGPLELRGLAATAQTMLACRLSEIRSSTERWARLARRGANPLRLVWENIGTDHEINHPQRYLDALGVPNTVQLLSASMVARLNSSGLGEPGPDTHVPEAAGVLSALAALGIDLDDVAAGLERRRSALDQDSLADSLDRLSAGSERR